MNPPWFLRSCINAKWPASVRYRSSLRSGRSISTRRDSWLTAWQACNRLHTTRPTSIFHADLGLQASWVFPRQTSLLRAFEK